MIPNGVLNPDGGNTLALAVTSNGGPGNGLEKVALTNLRTVRGGVPVTLDRSPGFSARTYGAGAGPPPARGRPQPTAAHRSAELEQYLEAARGRAKVNGPRRASA